MVLRIHKSSPSGSHSEGRSVARFCCIMVVMLGVFLIANSVYEVRQSAPRVTPHAMTQDAYTRDANIALGFISEVRLASFGVFLFADRK
jgi:hypothetical protein